MLTVVSLLTATTVQLHEGGRGHCTGGFTKVVPSSQQSLGMHRVTVALSKKTILSKAAHICTSHTVCLSTPHQPLVLITMLVGRCCQKNRLSVQLGPLHI